MQAEQIDRDAATDSELFPCPACFGKDELAPSCSICSGRGIVADPEAFARHRQQARAEVVGEIVAELRALHWTHRDAEPAKRIADLIEAKFGGRDASDD